MITFLLIACPGCILSTPLFLVLSLFVGTVPTAYLLLSPYTRSRQTWGMPRFDFTRLVSLMIMTLCLVPFWFLGRQENSIVLVASCVGGLALCCFYLWLRACWLLDTHNVNSTGRELLFLGLLSPAILVLGTTVGSWGLGVIWVVPMWPGLLIPHTVFSAVVGVPIGLLVVAGLKYTFFQSKPVTTEDNSEDG